MKNSEGLQQAALLEYGADLHVALRSRKDELLYLRKLTELLFSYVMPPKATDCRYTHTIAHTHGHACIHTNTHKQILEHTYKQ